MSRFLLFIQWQQLLFGDEIDKNLGHRVGKSRTSLLPDMPRPLPLASNLMMKMTFAMLRMISIEYEDVGVDED